MMTTLHRPQAQDFPEDGADVVHIHPLYDPTRLDLLFKSIAQSVKFIGRYGDEQRQLWQKSQFVFFDSSSHSNKLTIEELHGNASALLRANHYSHCS